eukprot:TRINITY_DN604_c1_g2_i1.p1 TRINITY_DN604_c1_g2~~TRINITY_DN604_c1_g2_i1.p1  ORF type:complete len:169 (+),score=62.36 TRINITY_DN604_c1_g2_i1:64-570(+)
MSATTPACTSTAYFFGAMGSASALIFANLGAAYGTAKAGVGVAHLSLVDSTRIMRGIVPVVMAGILGIYGLIVSVIITSNVTTTYAEGTGYMHFGAGLAAGLSSLAAGLAIGIVGDTSVRAYGKQKAVFVAMILMLIFAEALGLYGMIISLLMNSKATSLTACEWKNQ